MIAGLGGDTGKTRSVSVSAGSGRRRDYKVIPFKKGPDYIDMGWLSRAANHPCYNIDLFLMNKDQILSSFQHEYKERGYCRYRRQPGAV